MKVFYILSLTLLIISLEGCFNKKEAVKPKFSQSVNNSSLWYKKHYRISEYKRKYHTGNEPELMWQKASPYLSYIRKVFKHYQLPKELCLLPMIESSFNPNAANTRAAGLWQFIVPTAKEYGLKINFFSDQRYDWKKSTVAAAEYLSKLAVRYNGDWALVLAAYNMGPGALSRAMTAQSTNDYWQLKIRSETMNYVPKFVALLQIIREEAR